MKCFIYVLCDPITEEIRYVGKTISPKKRLQKHIYESRKPKYRKESWIKSILNRSLEPIMQIIDVVDFEMSGLFEEMYISQFKGWGINLTNLQGKSCNGISRHSEVTRLKISNKLKGRTQTDYTKQKRKKSVTIAWQDSSLREQQSKRSKELNALGIIGTKGRPSAKKGVPLSLETKSKLSESIKKYYSENKSRKIWCPKNKEDIIYDYVNSEMSLNNMSLKYSVNRNMITKLMKREGIKLRKDFSKSISIEVLIDLLGKGLKNKEIATHLGVSLAQVEKYKHKYKLTKKRNED